MILQDEQLAYQAYLEAVRLDPDNEQLQEDLLKARRAVEVAWLERLVSGD